MNNPHRSRRWSFVRPSHSNAFLVLEALGTVCGVLLLAFIPFRYAVKRQITTPLRSDGIFQLGRELSIRSAEILDMRDPAGVLNTNGRSGYLTSLPGQHKRQLPPGETISFPANTQAPIEFQALPETEIAPAQPLPTRQTSPAAEQKNAVMMTENGSRIAEIKLPAGVLSTNGQTIIRLAGGKDFPRSELLQSCGSDTLDKLALAQSRKRAANAPEVIIVFWPQRHEPVKTGETRK